MTRVILLEAALRLKTTTVLLATAAAGGVFLINGGATAAQPASATGGGQTMVGSQGAGDTIAFTARNGADGAATGQVQYVDRNGGTGQDQTVQHGVIDCFVVDPDGKTARMSGTWTSGDLSGDPFALYVQDNGEGDGSDIVAVTDVDSTSCAKTPDNPNDFALARGNAQVRPGSGS